MKSRLLGSLILFLTMVSCSQNAGKVTCTPNFQGTGMSVYVQYVGDNSNGTAAYTIKLCQDAIPSGFGYSVYGISSDSPVTDPANSVRLAHLDSTSSYSGAQMSVDFRTLDTHFAIYLDKQQAGSFVLSTDTEMVRGALALAASTVADE
jgi:hypothetical protein